MSATRRITWRAVGRALLGALLLFWGWAAHAGTFPERPVHMIVAFPAGGGTDIVARLIAKRLDTRWGHPVIVENHGGAGGVLGTEMAARAPADGYTILMATLGNLAINPHLYSMRVDPLKAFAPITNVVAVSFVLVANPGLPVKTVRDLIELAKKRPEQITYSSSGIGGAPHLAGELFDEMAGVKLAHIPYKGSGPSFSDLLGGQVSLTFDSLIQALPYVKEGTLRPLAVLAATRSALLPDVPTLAESGVPGYNFANWFGLVAPAGTPADVIRKLNADVREVLADPAVRKQLAGMGVVPADSSPEQFAELIQADSRKWGRIIHERGIRAP
jgi:tripartite-type tricarboxylate transporter receptor subunit TctC